MMEYIELHCHSNFSLLDGASHPETLVEQAARLGMSALALTDHDAVYGVVRFVQAARQHGIKAILGAELTLADGAHLTLLVENATGWRSLCHLISLARHNAPKGEASLPYDILADHTEGLIALSGCRQGEMARALRRDDQTGAIAAARRYYDLFGSEHFWIELQHHLLPEDNELVTGLARLARDLRLGYVATNNVHYATRADHRLQDVLVCIRHNTTIEQSAHLRRPNSEYYLKPAQRMAPLFAAYPGALANTLHIAERCDFELQAGLQDLPCFPTPPGMDSATYLRHLCQVGLNRRYAETATDILARLDYELAVIQRAGLANYFLIVWDLVHFARASGIRCQGRGSAANSLVAYLLDITPVDPLALDLVFERFLSDERQMAPDIDIDFQADRREEVIQYVYEKYGADHTGMACTFVTFRARSALRDVGKALGLPLHLVDQSARVLDTHQAGRITDSPRLQEMLGESSRTAPWRQAITLCREIDDFPRHLSIHNGGMIITGPPLAERVPTEPATMPGRVVVQWDKDSLEDAGLVKIDLLGLRMLSAIAEALDLIEVSTGQRPDLDGLCFDDSVVYDLISQADTIGVFQVESRAQSQMQPLFQPRGLADLVVAISLIRPGPIQGNMVHPYLRRRLGNESVTYPDPRLEGALAETLGVILFQEQVLKVARDLAGFSAGQGELLRRALGSKHAGAALEKLHAAFVAGAEAQGVSAVTAERIFEALRAFGCYSFPKSHAAAFAVLVYQSAWLKRYYPAALYAALLNHQPMGFWSPAVLAGDARRHGIPVLPVDVARSEVRCTVENGGVRLGLLYVKGLGETGAARLVDTRQSQTFVDLTDLCRRTQLPPRLVEHLILAGALDSWGIPRRKLLWTLGKLHYPVDTLALDFADDGVRLPLLSTLEKLSLEQELLGLFPGVHLLELYRPWLVEHGMSSSVDIKNSAPNDSVRVVGLLVVHQAPPTAKGFHFLTLEDEYGLMDVIVRPNLYRSFARVLHTAGILAVRGVIQRSGAVINVLAGHVAAVLLPDETAQLDAKGAD
ncbi:MAG: error-prone DNA polymerase [Chloroflexi bacterium]|nr:error-prone DNA polymerase [Chloroflexota bacterium]